LRIIRHCSMLDHPGVPNVREAHFFEFLQGLIRNIIKLPAAVLFDRAVIFIQLFGISKQAGQ